MLNFLLTRKTQGMFWVLAYGACLASMKLQMAHAYIMEQMLIMNMV